MVAAGRAMNGTLLTTTEEAYRNEYFSISNDFVSAQMALDDLKRSVSTEKGLKQVEDAQNALKAYIAKAKELVRENPAATLGRLDTVDRLFKELRPLGDEAEGLIKR